jgi:hypothetical protein
MMKDFDWAGLLMFLAGAFVVSMFWVGYEHRPRPPPAIADFKQLDEVVARIKALESGRCMSVTTPRIDITVYPTPNVGVHKVPK